MRTPPKGNSWTIRSIQAGLCFVGLAIWELASRHHRIYHFFFSSPTQIVWRIIQWSLGGEIYRHALLTFTETLLGFFFGVVGGLGLALICYYLPWFHRVIRPLAEVTNGMPRAVFGPIFILWFGLGISSKVVLAASLVLFIVFFATLTGLEEVDANLIHKVRLMGATRLDLLVHVLLPSALSWVFASLRSSVGFALAGAVIGEYIGASRGIGYQIALAEGNLDATGVFAGLAVLSLMVLGMNAGLKRIEQLLTPWQPSGT
jgi:NitT/TauT family transport system permease protein